MVRNILYNSKIAKIDNNFTQVIFNMLHSLSSTEIYENKY